MERREIWKMNNIIYFKRTKKTLNFTFKKGHFLFKFNDNLYATFGNTDYEELYVCCYKYDSKYKSWDIEYITIDESLKEIMSFIKRKKHLEFCKDFSHRNKKNIYTGAGFKKIAYYPEITEINRFTPVAYGVYEHYVKYPYHDEYLTSFCNLDKNLNIINR
jgi:hypothetical protein